MVGPMEPTPLLSLWLSPGISLPRCGRTERHPLRISQSPPAPLFLSAGTLRAPRCSRGLRGSPPAPRGLTPRSTRVARARPFWAPRDRPEAGAESEPAADWVSGVEAALGLPASGRCSASEAGGLGNAEGTGYNLSALLRIRTGNCEISMWKLSDLKFAPLVETSTLGTFLKTSWPIVYMSCTDMRAIYIYEIAQPSAYEIGRGLKRSLKLPEISLLHRFYVLHWILSSSGGLADHATIIWAPEEQQDLVFSVLLMRGGLGEWGKRKTREQRSLVAPSVRTIEDESLEPNLWRPLFPVSSHPFSSQTKQEQGSFLC